MDKENKEKKDIKETKSKDNEVSKKKVLILKRRNPKKIFLMVLLMFNQHLIIQ